MRLKTIFLSFSLFLSQWAVGQDKDILQNKNVPDELKEAISEALQYYPELTSTRIDFVFKENIKHSYMQAQPKWYGLFQSKKKRAYVIKITSVFRLNGIDIPVQELPNDILIGWIGHELGHIMDYSERGPFNMMGFGINYLTSKRKMIHAENQADIYAIKHNLGNKILSCKRYVLTTDLFSKEYRDRIEGHYMSIEEVERLLDEREGVVSIK